MTKNSVYLAEAQKRLDGLSWEECIEQTVLLYDALKAGGEEELARELGIDNPPPAGVPPKKPVGRVVPIDQVRRSG